MLLARKELSAARKFDYCILNQNLATAVSELKNIFLRESSS
jgi:guanylate kinase